MFDSINIFPNQSVSLFFFSTHRKQAKEAKLVVGESFARGHHFCSTSIGDIHHFLVSTIRVQESKAKVRPNRKNKLLLL